MADSERRLLCAELHLVIRGFVPPGVHKHGHDELLLVLRGRWRSRCGEGEFDLGPRQLLWLPMGTAHEPVETAQDRRTDLLYAAFTASALSEPPAGAAQPRMLTDHRGRLTSTLLWMSELMRSGVADGRQQAQHLLAALLIEVGRLALHPGIDRFAALLDFIEDHLHDPLTVGEMARFLDLGPRQTERLFRQRCGCAPREWLRRRRQEKALHLRSLGQTLACIAPQVGRRSLAHLSRELTSPRPGPATSPGRRASAPPASV